MNGQDHVSEKSFPEQPNQRQTETAKEEIDLQTKFVDGSIENKNHNRELDR
jgi:hypothetical protein